MKHAEKFWREQMNIGCWSKESKEKFKKAIQDYNSMTINTNRKQIK